MTIKERFEAHPIGFGLALFIAGVSLATGLVWPAQVRHHNAAEEELRTDYQKKLQPLEMAVNSIKRQVGDQADFIRVDELVIEPAEASEVPSVNQSFPGEKFYALPPHEEAGWNAVQTTELDVIADTMGLPPREVPAALGLSEKVLTLLPVHLWRNADVKKVAGFEGLAKLTPQIMVQRVPYSVLGVLDDELAMREAEDIGVEELDSLADLYRGDATGQLLLQELAVSLSLAASPQATVSLSTVQKRGNVVYARIETALKDVTVDGRHYAEYYFDRESIFVSGPDSVFLVKTLVPSADRRSPHATYINTWLSSLRVIAT